MLQLMETALNPGDCRFDVPVGPLVLGVILMPLAEAQFRRAMADQSRRSVGVCNLPAFSSHPRFGGGGTCNCYFLLSISQITDVTRTAASRWVREPLASKREPICDLTDLVLATDRY